MKVEQLMTKEAATCRPEDSLNEAARIMWELDCGFVPITESDESRRVIGVLTDRDVCMGAYFHGRSLKETSIREAMSTGICSCKPGDEIAQAESTMRDAQVYRLPVLDDAGQLLGVISLADVAREAAREADSKRPEVTAAEVGGTVAAISRPRQASAAA